MAAAFRFPAYNGSNFINNRRYLDAPYTKSYYDELVLYADFMRTNYPNRKGETGLTTADLLKWVSRFAGNYYNYQEQPIEYLNTDGGALWSAGWWRDVPLVIIDAFTRHGIDIDRVTVAATTGYVFATAIDPTGLYDGMKMVLNTACFTSAKNSFTNLTDGMTVYIKKANPIPSGGVHYSNRYSVQFFTDSALTTPLTTAKASGTYYRAFSRDNSYISGTTLIITDSTGGTVLNGQTIAGTGVTAGTKITANQAPTTVATTSITSNSTTITVNTNAIACTWPTGARVTIAGATPSAYNGTWTITGVSTTQFTIASTSNPGTATVQGTVQGYGDGSVGFYTVDTSQTVTNQTVTGEDKGSGDYTVAGLHADSTEQYPYKMDGARMIWKGSLANYGGIDARESTETLFGVERTIQYPLFKRGFTTSRGGGNTVVVNMNNPKWLSGEQIGTSLTFEKVATNLEQDSVDATITADIAAGYLPAGATYTIGSSTNPYNNLIAPVSGAQIGHVFGDSVNVDSIVGNVITISSNTTNKIMNGNFITGTIDGVELESSPVVITKTGSTVENSSFVTLTSITNVKVGYIISGFGMYANTVVTEVDTQRKRVRISKTAASTQNNVTYEFRVPGVEILSQLTSTYTTNQASTTITPAKAAGSTTFVVASATNINIGDIVAGTGIPVNTIVLDIDGTTITVSNATTATTSGTYTFRRGGQSGTYRINRAYGSLGSGIGSITDSRYNHGHYPKLICISPDGTDAEVNIYGYGNSTPPSGVNSFVDPDAPSGANSTLIQDPFDGVIPAEWPGRFSTTSPVALYLTNIPDNYRPRWATQANDVQWESPWETVISNQDISADYDATHNSAVKQWPRHILPQNMTWSIDQPSRVTESANLTRWTRDTGHRRWRFKVQYPPMSRDDFMPFMTAIHTAHGQARGFRWYIGDIAGFTQMQNRAGFIDTNNGSYNSVTLRDMICYTNETVAAGETFLTLDGFRPKVNNAVNAGDIIKIQHYSTTTGRYYEPYVIINTGDSDEMGRVRIRLSHPLKTGIQLGAAHHFNPSHIWVSLNSDTHDIDISTAHLYGFTVEFVTQAQLGETGSQNQGIV